MLRPSELLDLELTIAASPGWSETGGPWIKPEDGIKKLVWSVVLVVESAEGAPNALVKLLPDRR